MKEGQTCVWKSWARVGLALWWRCTGSLSMNLLYTTEQGGSFLKWFTIIQLNKEVGSRGEQSSWRRKINTYIWSRGRLCHSNGSLAWLCSRQWYPFILLHPPQPYPDVFFRGEGLFVRFRLTCVSICADACISEVSRAYYMFLSLSAHSSEAGSGTYRHVQNTSLSHSCWDLNPGPHDFSKHS